MIEEVGSGYGELTLGYGGAWIGRARCLCGYPAKDAKDARVTGVGLAGSAYQWYLDGQPFGGEAPGELPMGQRLTARPMVRIVGRPVGGR